MAHVHCLELTFRVVYALHEEGGIGREERLAFLLSPSHISNVSSTPEVVWDIDGPQVTHGVVPLFETCGLGLAIGGALELTEADHGAMVPCLLELLHVQWHRRFSVTLPHAATGVQALLAVMLVVEDEISHALNERHRTRQDILEVMVQSVIESPVIVGVILALVGGHPRCELVMPCVEMDRGLPAFTLVEDVQEFAPDFLGYLHGHPIRVDHVLEEVLQ
mmetsp:Transcript_75654/g.162270  ORF Transcript_75654/g.162270 Transcript_75654/m.162270 type:complete len:220 (+) Transcript_75654:90-749(+)